MMEGPPFQYVNVYPVGFVEYEGFSTGYSVGIDSRTGIVRIETPDTQSLFDIEIFNLSGQTICQSITSKSFEICSLDGMQNAPLFYRVSQLGNTISGGRVKIIQ
jgi:hypothetical protein